MHRPLEAKLAPLVALFFTLGFFTLGLASCSAEEPREPTRSKPSPGASEPSPLEDTPAPAQSPPDEGLDLDDARVGVGYRDVQTVGKGEVQEIVTAEIAAANAKYWGAETVSNDLVARPLQALKVLCLGPWGAASQPPDVADIFTDDARITPLVPLEVEEVEVTHGVVRRHWTQPAEALERAAWKAHLDELHANSKRVRWALWKPAEVRLTDYGAEAILKVHLNRELPSGALQHDSGKWKTEWVRESEEEWRCRKATPYQDAATLYSERPHFVDATLEAFADTGLDPRLPTALSGVNRGVALSDLDADGDLDLVTTLPLAILYNRGDGTFEDRTRAVARGRGEFWTTDSEFFGVLVEDFDRDGDRDIFVSPKRTHALLFRQGADGTFQPEHVTATNDGNIPSSLSAHDVDGDGWLEVFVSGYGPFVHPGPNNPTDATNARPNQVLRGLPGGRFENVTEAWGFLPHGTRWTFIGAWGDVDADGDVDLYTANDFGPNVLYRQVSRDQVSRDPASRDPVRFEAELEDSEDIDSGFSMSATFADVDNDLDLDLYVSNMASTAANRVRKMDGDPSESRLGVDMDDVRRRMSKGNTLLLNEGEQLVEAGPERGAKNASWAWGTALFDYDCDGDLDIHSLNGMWTQGADDGRDL